MCDRFSLLNMRVHDWSFVVGYKAWYQGHWWWRAATTLHSLAFTSLFPSSPTLPSMNITHSHKDRQMNKWLHSPFPKKGDLGIAKNYRDITLISIAAKIYNALLRNRIEPKIDKILWKNQNGFWSNRSTTSQILTIRRIKCTNKKP